MRSAAQKQRPPTRRRPGAKSRLAWRRDRSRAPSLTRSRRRHQVARRVEHPVDPGPILSGKNLSHEGKPDQWVLNLSHPKAAALPLDVFGPRWAQWILDAAAAAACPPDYVVAPLLAAASALIGNARWAQAWPGWQEPPHLWCGSVGHSGQGKSPGADPILRHVLPAIERKMAQDFEFKIEVQLALIKAAANEQGGLESDLAYDLIEPRFVENDLTIEKVASVLSKAAPKGLLMVRDELAGWLLGMNRFNAGARAFWLEAYGGRPYSVDRVKSPERIFVQRLAVAWYGGIQPARLTKLIADADDGLLARFIWFWPDPVEFKRPKTTPNLDFALSAFERLSLLELAPQQNPCDKLEPRIVPLSEAAASKLEDFARQALALQSDSSGLLNSASGKARGLTLRLSLVIAYLRWAAEDGMAPAPGEIGETALGAALTLVRDYLIPTAGRVYGDGAHSNNNRNGETLARWIIQTQATEVHVRHLQRVVRLPGLTTAPRIHRACQILVQAGWLTLPPRGSNNGRARQVYTVRKPMPAQ